MGKWESHPQDQSPTITVPAYDNANVFERRDHGLRMLLNLAPYKILHKGHCYPSRAGSILSWQQNLVSSHYGVINACTGVSESH